MRASDMLARMSVLPRFFLLAGLAGLALWLTGAPYPFPLLATFIMACSAAGLVLSVIYVHAFMPGLWDARVAGLRRFWNFLFRPSAR